MSSTVNVAYFNVWNRPPKQFFYMVGKGVKKAGLANIRRFRCLHCCLGLCKQEFIVGRACFIHIINLHYFRMKTR